ncbi:MAG: 50S ribosome-binding GTPase [Thermoplasmata archaeon]|nr:50S ribosome-binding GTPase [Thermoplasmata archaeon]
MGMHRAEVVGYTPEPVAVRDLDEREGTPFFSRISVRSWLRRLFRRKNIKIGIYGPPNAGKTTLANRIAMDWAGEVVGSVSDIPHETRKTKVKRNISIRYGKRSLSMDIIDTPGVATKIDFHEFVDTYGMSEEESRQRAREATEGVIEAIKWLDQIDGILLAMDVSEDPFTQVNITILGNLEARKLPILIIANKVDKPGTDPAVIKNAFPQHTTVPVSALTGYNMERLYESMVRHFR